MQRVRGGLQRVHHVTQGIHVAAPVSQGQHAGRQQQQARAPARDAALFQPRGGGVTYCASHARAAALKRLYRWGAAAV
jgi:hypothetical protein